jgi:hypothetical protein
LLTSVYEVCVCVCVVSVNEIICLCMRVSTRQREKKICRRSTNCRPTSTTLPREPRSQRGGGGGVEAGRTPTLAHRQTQNIASQRSARAHSSRIRTHARTHAHTHKSHTQTHTDTYKHTQTHANTHRHTQTHTDTYTHTQTHTTTHPQHPLTGEGGEPM